MTAGNFPACLSAVLRWEGGYVDHPSDPGGATNMGITRKTLAAWRHVVPWTSLPKSAVQALTRAEAAEIYAAQYWRPLRGDDLPPGPDLATLDYGVNSGVGRAAKEVQAVAGVAADGKIGPKTLLAIGMMGQAAFVSALCARRMSFLRSLAIWNTFGKGWSRRVADIEATALGMCTSKGEIAAAAKDARGKAATQAGGAVATGAGAPAAGQQPDLSWLPWWGWALLAAVIVAPLVIRAIVNAQRAAALGKVANA